MPAAIRAISDAAVDQGAPAARSNRHRGIEAAAVAAAGDLIPPLRLLPPRARRVAARDADAQVSAGLLELARWIRRSRLQRRASRIVDQLMEVSFTGSAPRASNPILLPVGAN